ncbi:MAG: hypothetical protein ACE3JK_01535 [Sporolactobacillus sp.]
MAKKKGKVSGGDPFSNLFRDVPGGEHFYHRGRGDLRCAASKAARSMTLRSIKLIYPDLADDIKTDALLLTPTVAITLDDDGVTAWHVTTTSYPDIYMRDDRPCIFQYDYVPRRYTMADLTKIDGMTATEFILSMELRKGEDFR